MKTLKRFLKNRKGSFSILFVTLTLIVVLVVTGFITILTESWTMQEVQSIMDTSSVSALRTGVDETKLRVEKFDVDGYVVENSYKKMVSSLLVQSKKIKDYQFVNTIVKTNYNDTWGIGYQYNSPKAHPQAQIDSTMIIAVEASPIFDLVPGIEKSFYNSRGGSDFVVSYLGRTQDGEIELAIRSVSRIVYR